MSGGSYEYLCYADFDDLIEKQKEIQRMSDRLAGLGYARDAAKETQEALLIIRQCENRINTIKERLFPVWKAIEWWDSCDSLEDGVQKALEEYRGENKCQIQK